MVNPIEYLNNVLLNWVEFCKHHPYFEEAIQKILLENQRLKNENEILKKEITVKEGNMLTNIPRLTEAQGAILADLMKDNVTLQTMLQLHFVKGLTKEQIAEATDYSVRQTERLRAYATRLALKRAIVALEKEKKKEV